MPCKDYSRRKNHEFKIVQISYLRIMEENLTYEKAYSELQQIITDIENDEVSIDLLSVKVKRAAELIDFCKNKLSSTELDVQKILDGLKG